MHVKPRKYASPLRQSQALATRSRVLDAARQLFAAHGYGGVRLAKVAQVADVSLPALYKTFGSKLELLRACVMAAIRNDIVDDGPVESLAWFRQQMDAADAHEQLRLIARNCRDVGDRSAALLVVLRSAAAEEPALTELLETIDRDRLKRSQLTARSLASKATLLISEEMAALTLWAVSAPEVYVSIAGLRGPAQFESWCRTTLTNALLFAAEGRLRR